MPPSDASPRTELLAALAEHQIAVLSDDGTHIAVDKDYLIEIEANGIYKLLWKGRVRAPFDNLGELCQHINWS